VRANITDGALANHTQFRNTLKLYFVDNYSSPKEDLDEHLQNMVKTIGSFMNFGDILEFTQNLLEPLEAPFNLFLQYSPVGMNQIRLRQIEVFFFKKKHFLKLKLFNKGWKKST